MNAHLHAVLHKNYCTVRGIVKMLILCHMPTDKRNTTRRYEKEAVDLPWQANKNFRIERETNRETDRQIDRQRKRQIQKYIKLHRKTEIIKETNRRNEGNIREAVRKCVGGFGEEEE